MKYSIIVVVLTGLVCFSACTDHPGKPLMPEIASCDSAAILYYHVPGDPRFFSMTKVYDKSWITGFSEEMNGDIISGKDSCTTEGKIYFYGKGDTVHIVYFSRLQDCMTLSFIKTGVKYYTGMGKELRKDLDELQQTAKEPVAPQ